jgi:ABC-type multidrug transport system fused ATPase/permease subunit
MAVALSIKITGTVMDLWLPLILAHMIDSVAPSGLISHICAWGAAMAACAVLSITGNTIGNRMSSAVSRDAIRVMRRDLFAKVSGLSCAQIDRVSIPSLISRLTSDTYNVHRLFSGMMRMGVRAPVLFIGGIVLTLTMEPVLTLVMLGIVPFMLRDVSFGLRQGETLGILGETGCGKSTIIQLLLRFYDVGSGAVRINGDDVRGIPAGQLYAMFGVALQNDVLFAESISQNIDFGRSLTGDQIKAAADCAQAEHFVDSLEDGFSHHLMSRGANLSGGQRQRILIARALAAEPEILILDDSSSALDYKTDANLRTALRERFGRTTTIIVAQRISSIKDADRIMILERGRVIGYGTHSDLAATCPIYRETLESQMGHTDAQFLKDREAVAGTLRSEGVSVAS